MAPPIAIMVMCLAFRSRCNWVWSPNSATCGSATIVWPYSFLKAGSGLSSDEDEALRLNNPMVALLIQRSSSQWDIEIQRSRCSCSDPVVRLIRRKAEQPTPICTLLISTGTCLEFPLLGWKFNVRCWCSREDTILIIVRNLCSQAVWPVPCPRASIFHCPVAVQPSPFGNLDMSLYLDRLVSCYLSLLYLAKPLVTSY